MKKNMGNPDRIIRIVIAAVLGIGAGIAGFGSIAGIILLILAAVMLVTSAVGFCPLYAPFKFSTKRGPSTN